MERYEIRVVGHVSERRARSLGCDLVRWLSTGESALALEVPDSAALYGRIAAIADSGLVMHGMRLLDEVADDADPQQGDDGPDGRPARRRATSEEGRRP